MAHDVQAVDEWVKPLPQPDNVSAPYWQAAAEGRLLVQQCPKCGQRQFYPRALCTNCGSDPEWLECSGRGTVHTFTIVRQYGARPFRDELPYAIAMVELEEGPMMLGAVTDCDVDDVSIGMPVEVHYVKAADDIGIPYWRPASG
jgi:uncharacterized OB-fold protein